MARPRKFEEADVLVAAMTSFWRHGYTGTTTRRLEEISGVGIRSLANTFGDKETLFTRALTYYREKTVENIAIAFNPPTVAAIIAHFERLTASIDSEHPRNSGCLMVNTVFELEEPSEQIAEEMELFFELWRSTFQKALDNDKIAHSRARSEFLLGNFWGVAGLIRIAGDVTAARPMVSVITHTIGSWTMTD